MAKETILLVGNEAREAIKAGIKKAYDAVKPSLGPAGKSALLGVGGQWRPNVIDDGVTILNNIQLDNRAEHEGLKLLREVAGKTNSDAGDSTTTSSVLSYNMLEAGIKNITAGANPTLIRKGINQGTKIVVDELKKMSRPTKGITDIERVATISSNDPEMGKLVANAIQKVGDKGFISVEKGIEQGLHLEVIEGMQIGSGMSSFHFGLKSPNGTCVLKNVAVAIVDRVLQYSKEVIPFLAYASDKNKSMLIVCEDIQGVALQTLFRNYLERGINVCAIKAPSGGKNKREILDDIALYTGATVFGKDRGDDIENWNGDELCGKADVVTVGPADDEKSYTLIRVEKIPEVAKKRVKELEAELKVTKSLARKEHLNIRKAGLSTGIALLRASYGSDTETDQKIAKLEDAKNAAISAVEEGIIPGGGTALVRCENAIAAFIQTNANTLREDEILGLKIVKSVLGKPVEIIADNAGHVGQVILGKVRELKGNFGFNAETEKFEDLMKTGVIDATKSIRTAMENAASVVSTVLMTETVSVVVAEEDLKR